MKQIIFVLTLLISFTSFQLFANDCGFMGEIDKLLETEPKVAVEVSKFGNNVFLSVADGFTPSNPGFDSSEELGCVGSSYKFHMIWAGADFHRCEGQGEKAAHANKYAEKYNVLLKQLLTDDGNYKCTSQLLEEERKRRCEKTGQKLCSGKEDWSGALHALSKYVWSLNSTATTGYRPEIFGEYSVSIREPAHRQQIQENACEIFPKFGSKMDVTIHIELAKFSPDQDKWEREDMADVVCKY